MKTHAIAMKCLLAAGVLSLAGVSAPATAQSDISVNGVVWTWGEATLGTSRLVRTDSGISATLNTEGLPPGHAMTLWFVVFNNPAACPGDICGAEDLVLSDAAQADFLWAGGSIVGGDGSVNLAGSLQVGDTRRSAFPEIGMPDRVLGLTNPRGAEVHLVVHSHGPMVPGQTLRSQLNSFTGGCVGDFLGNAFGLAESMDDVPAAVGECSSVQASVHMAE